jgi:murein DD-endopeptidase MepM/ murein hydrolase activator NlpD
MERAIFIRWSHKTSWTGYRKQSVKFKRPVDIQFPISGKYGEPGHHWSHHVSVSGDWVRAPGPDGLTRHKGVDFACPEGTEVLAATDGFVARSGWENADNPKQGFGLRVRQSFEAPSGRRLEIVYGHLNCIHLTAGDPIAKGDRIGLSGKTGRVSGAHLHVEILDGEGQYYPLILENDEDVIHPDLDPIRDKLRTV